MLDRPFSASREWAEDNLHGLQVSIDQETMEVEFGLIDKSGTFFGTDAHVVDDSLDGVSFSLDTAEQIALQILEWVKKCRVSE